MNDNITDPLRPVDDAEHPVRKLLRSLPVITAREGFELRLQHRLQESGPDVSTSSAEKFSRFAFPRIAFSAIAILFFFVLLYSVMMAPGITPLVLPTSGRGGLTKSAESLPAVVSGHIQASQTSPSAASPRTDVGSEERGKNINPQIKQKSLSPTNHVTFDYSQSNSVPESSGGNPAEQNRPPVAPVETSRRALLMNQQESVTGTLELRQIDSSATPGDKNWRIAPRVKDEFGVGVVGTSISSPLLDSIKSDSLKRLKKQLLQPTASPAKPHN